MFRIGTQPYSLSWRPSIPRREFVKALLLATGYCALPEGAKPNLVTALEAEDLPYPAGTFTLNLNDFPDLLYDYGSVAVSVTNFPDILVTRLPGNRFYAVTSTCTHQACTVGIYDRTAKALVCPCHGSHYSPDGQVISGPAPKPLYSYKTHFDGWRTLTLDLVRFSFPIHGTVVPKGRRLQIRFSSEEGYNYEIRYKFLLSDEEWASVPFSQTVDGKAEDTLIMGTGDNITLYVNPGHRSGFYVVARWKLLGAAPPRTSG